MTADIFAAYAQAKARHPAGGPPAIDVDTISPAEIQQLLHALTRTRSGLAAQRRELAEVLRRTTADLERIDRQPDDIEQSENWLLA
jgi:hypothetical protein